MDQIAMKLGDSLLSAALSSLVDKAASSDLLKYARKKNIDVEIKKWHKNLIMLNAVLADAEEKKTKSQAIKEWLMFNLADLHHAVHNAANVVGQVAPPVLNLVGEVAPTVFSIASTTAYLVPFVAPVAAPVAALAAAATAATQLPGQVQQVIEIINKGK
ncbi:hypothetical protein ACFE04_010887 [Oxalis oulophora]